MATNQAAIKGTVFAAALAEVNRLVSEGRLNRDQLEVALDTDALDLLDDEKQVSPVAWYPMQTFSKLVELTCQALYGGTEVGHRQMGAAAAQKLIDLGIYRQANATVADDGDGWRDQLVRLPALLYNFSKWKLEEPVPGRIELTVSDAKAFPSWFPARLEGYAGVLVASATGVPIEGYRRSWDRPSPDVIKLTFVRI